MGINSCYLFTGELKRSSARFEGSVCCLTAPGINGNRQEMEVNRRCLYSDELGLIKRKSARVNGVPAPGAVELQSSVSGSSENRFQFKADAGIEAICV